LARRVPSLSLPIVMASVTVALSIALLVGWTLIILRNWQLAQVTDNVWLLVSGILSFVVIATVLVLFVVFLAREITEVRRQDSFVDSVTHELKSPLASLYLCLQTIERRELAEDQKRKLIEMMLDDVDRLSGFVDDVLEASRVAYGRRVYELRPIDVTELVRKSSERLEKRYRERQPTITVECDDGLILHTDATAIETIVMNLLDNAVKYSGDDAKISVRCWLHVNGKARLEVTDNGIGLEPKMKKRIFERFVRGHGEEVRQRRGTGIGLYVVSSLAKTLGGRVWAESPGLGSGSTMTVELPGPS
jgi:signal transduction histidine kinase